MPPAPTELLLVSRMGDNNSPILLTEVPLQIATFNRPFELSELVGNLDGVMYLYSGDVVNVTCVSDVEESETKYFLAYDNGESHIGELSVDGNTLLCSEKGEENYLFDLDFKHQNRKFFEQANGTYAVALPWLGLDDDSKVLFSVSDSRGKTVTIHYVDNDYRAWGQAGGAIREISWFNELLTSANITNIVSLVNEIIKLEYSLEAAGGITVTASNVEPTQVDGNWNLFTDGSPYVPIRILSRFPNGSPLSFSDDDLVICTFDRSCTAAELVGKINAVISDTSGNCFNVTAAEYALYQIQLQAGASPCLVATIQGNKLVTSTDEDPGYIYDIDIDHQFRRSVPVGVTKMNVQIPQLLGNPSTGQGVAIVTDSESPDQLYVVADNANKRPYICQGDTVQNQQGVWANNLTFANVSALLQAIVAMEFTGYDEIPINVQDSAYKESQASGYVVTPLIPQTLS